MSALNRPELVAVITGWVHSNTREPDLDPAALGESTDLIASGILDSVGFLQLLAFLEDYAGREIDLSDLDPADFTTVGGLSNHVLRTSTVEAPYVTVR